ncbi:MAG: sulfide/dihydroorotate dehydrogenase-like FAD/NAD-binding protein [Oscillospiraceae bacterium]|jgi:ferredoxin--NADP+ reductase|nr:sulfide/dihydroorotate dehydrogenase-like FAD/NAD-binding protein [Oscillospiraceae bacterium]
MYKIVGKRALNAAGTTFEMLVEAPLVARKCLAGQFIIFRTDEFGERVPLTIADYDREAGTVTIMFQPVGRSTQLLAGLEPGDYIRDFVGPLGRPTEIADLKRAAVVGGGVGCAIAYPVAKAMHAAGVAVDMIAGFRSRDLVMLEDELKNSASRLFIMTDDGSCGEKGFVTDKLRDLLEAGGRYDEVVAIGPGVMMKFVSLTTKPYGIKTVVSLNPIMIDGTGMCGGCRVSVGGETKFACVDGPEFDGQLVDWDELLRRGAFYRDAEAEQREHACYLTGGARHG